ncbi:nucleotide-binding domain-containing protein [Mycena filopes]|nr:nucleotide-binding domain-containing protein [Mycena filopes]
MGSLFSRLRLIYQTLKSISDSFSAVSERISRDPGFPTATPSRSYWCFPPSSLDERPISPLPEHADVVIIGSGIAGAAIARALLDSSAAKTLRIVMLEARDVCSGATGRNGGHISPNTYQDYSDLASKYGAAAAQAIIRFRLAHLPALLAVAEGEGLLHASQARAIDQFDVYLNGTLYQRAKEALASLIEALPERRGKHTTYDDKIGFEHLQLSTLATSCISQEGGALHPYRLITGILARLLKTHPSTFHLFTHTPCTDISVEASGYCVTTPRGTLTTTHVIHATNAWAGHLLPGLRRKIVPMRGYMTAQRPGRTLAPSSTGKRAFVFYPGTSMLAFDYLTQQPGSPDNGAHPAPTGELMFGGGASLGGRAESALLDNIGITDDSEADSDFAVTAYLGGALERYFAPGWGAEGSDSGEREEGGWGAGRVKAVWAGILGLSADGQPWVGRVPRAVSGRAEPKPTPAGVKVAHLGLVPAGEWIAAGFTGEGMTHAWLSGVALAGMVLGESQRAGDASALPPQFLITEKRVREADIEAFFAEAD